MITGHRLEINCHCSTRRCRAVVRRAFEGWPLAYLIRGALEEVKWGEERRSMKESDHRCQ